MLQLCQESGLRIFNGRYDGDKDGNFTFVGNRGSSVVDYVISTPNLMKNVSYFHVHCPNILSDHCIIDFSFDVDVLSVNIDHTDDHYECLHEKYVWKNDLKNRFISDPSSEDIISKLLVFNDHVINAQSAHDIDNCKSEFSSIVDDISSPFKRKIVDNTSC